MLTSPLLLYNVPRCGPDSDKNVYNFGIRCFILDLDTTDLIMRFPRECPIKLRIKKINTKL